MTFRSWFFTEMPYPDLPPDDQFDSMRVTLPSRVFDPGRGADLYERYFDLYRTADAAGLDVMVNEHHATATCVGDKHTIQDRLKLLVGSPPSNIGGMILAVPTTLPRVRETLNDSNRAPHDTQRRYGAAGVA